MAIQFLKGVKASVKGLVYDVQGSQYLPWASAVALAGRPKLDVVTFGGLPYLPFFGGAAVAVEAEGDGGVQRVWLPVLSQSKLPVSIEKLDARDINDSLSRAKAKAIALTYGVGLSLYAGYGEDVLAFLKGISVTPDSDLATVEPAVSQKPGKSASSYVDWCTAYAAAKITDPTFRFDVRMFENIDPETGEVRLIPAKAVNGGWMVAVDLTYKGQSATEWLPIMGFQEVQTKNGPKKMDHQPLANPSVFDWNKAVMRCLTRGIACLTGYGLSVYAGEDVMSLNREVPASRHQTQAPAVQEVQEVQAPVQDDAEPEIPAASEPAFEESSANEPPDELVSKMLVRIGNIAALESIERARNDLSRQFAGTRALARFEAALDAKADALLMQAAAA